MLDGHDRLQAAELEGVTPRFVALWQRWDTTSPIDADAQANFVDSYQKAFDSGRMSPASRKRTNAHLVAMFRTTWTWPMTSASAKAEMGVEWALEVKERLDQLSSDGLLQQESIEDATSGLLEGPF